MARWYALDLTGHVIGGTPHGAFEGGPDRATAHAYARRLHGDRVWQVQSVLDYNEALVEQREAERQRGRKAGLHA